MLVTPSALMNRQKGAGEAIAYDAKVFIVAGASNAHGHTGGGAAGTESSRLPEIIGQGNLITNTKIYTDIGFDYLTAFDDANGGNQNSGASVDNDTFGPIVSMMHSIGEDAGEEVYCVLSSEGSTDLATDWLPPSGANYLALIDRIDAALEELRDGDLTPRVEGFLWVQGEEDATIEAAAENYGDNLIALIDALRARYWMAMPVVISKIYSATRTYIADVQAGQDAAVAARANVTLLDTVNLNRPDGVHYGNASQIALGRMAAAALGYAKFDDPVLNIMDTAPLVWWSINMEPH
jgi:hypothetical protein